MTLTAFSIAATKLPSRALSMKARDERIVSICAALQAERILAAPDVKLIMAGTRPAVLNPRIVTTAPFALGRMTPMGRPSSAIGRGLAPRMAEPAGNRL